MIDKKRVEGDLLRDIKRGIEIWESALADVPENPHPKYELSNLQKASENVDEATSILAVDYINRFLDTYILTRGSFNPYINIQPLGIHSEEEMRTLIGNERLESIKFIPAVRDQLRQQIYGKMGFEGILPTHEEIAKLEMAARECETAEERLGFEEQIELKQLALAEGPSHIQGGVPYVLASDVKRKYDNKREWIKPNDMSDSHTK